VWDGWLLLAELNGDNSVKAYNVHGLDLSQTLQGAGGIGGLLCRIESGTNYLFTFDGNGNVTDVLGSDALLLAHYEFDPFGRTVAQCGSYADQNLWRFGTKQIEPAWNLYYYGYRFYSPNLHTLLNRDPIGEWGGVDLYSFAGNAPSCLNDALGLKWTVTRQNSSQAEADSDCDNVKALADQIGLNADDYQQWLSPADGYSLPSSATDTMGSRKFRIPNTVYACWAGWSGLGIGKCWVDWNPSVAYLKQLGFEVTEYDYSSSSTVSDALQNNLTTSANSKSLHGLYYWGHGYAPSGQGDTSAGLVNQADVELLAYGSINLPYKMALGLVFACYSDDGASSLFSSASSGIWHGYSGVLNPVWPLNQNFNVNQYIKSGDQDTNK
jgi:RHS repeat-associated protein